MERDQFQDEDCHPGVRVPSPSPAAPAAYVLASITFRSSRATATELQVKPEPYMAGGMDVQLPTKQACPRNAKKFYGRSGAKPKPAVNQLGTSATPSPKPKPKKKASPKGKNSNKKK